MQEQPLTFGEKAVGLSFNPSGNEQVDKLKRAAADYIDACNKLRKSTEDGEMKRMLSLAITKTQEAQMWAVKAVTWRSK